MEGLTLLSSSSGDLRILLFNTGAEIVLSVQNSMTLSEEVMMDAMSFAHSMIKVPFLTLLMIAICTLGSEGTWGQFLKWGVLALMSWQYIQLSSPLLW